MKIRYWLMKSEPSVFSIDDLQRTGFTEWEGVRNFQVRNMIRDEMKEGDLAFFYHSNAKPPGIAGLCRICSSPKPDPTQWNPKSLYFDKKAKENAPIWWLVEVEFVEKFPKFITLNELKKHSELSGLPLLQKGSRLSITPVNDEQYHFICHLARQEAAQAQDLINQR